MPDGMAAHHDILAPHTSSTGALAALAREFDQAEAAEEQAARDARGRDEDSPVWKLYDSLNDVVGSIVDRIIAEPANTLPDVMLKIRALRWTRNGDTAGFEMFGYYPVTGRANDPTSDERLMVGIVADLYRFAGFPTEDIDPAGDVA